MIGDWLRRLKSKSIGKRSGVQRRRARLIQRSRLDFLALESRELLSTFTVKSTADSAGCAASSCSLRGAIEAANLSPGPDVINFAIPSTGVPTIRPKSELPVITDPVTIDGSTQPAGFVELDGSSLREHASTRCTLFACGLIIKAGSSTVRGLVINRFIGDGIYITEGGGNVIEGNRIGTDVTGLAAARIRSSGVEIRDSSGNTIGGTTAGARNVISATGTGGVYINRIQGTTENNLVQGNFIGINVDGTAMLSDGGFGIGIFAAANNTIGGSTAAAGNVISGTGYGVTLTSAQSERNLVIGNFIGTDITGTQLLSRKDSSTGVYIDGGADNTIGGTTPESRNVIDGFMDGVVIEGKIGLNGWTRDQTGTRNVVQGNLIGTDVSGTAQLGIRRFGVLLYQASSNTIGGTAAGAGNVVAFNGSDGVRIFEFPGVATSNPILGNRIFSNTGLGINLGDDEVTPNDSGDSDSGANDRLNFPVLTFLSRTDEQVVLQVDTHSGNRIEFFANDLAAGYRQGQRFLDAVTAPGNRFEITLDLLEGETITATATDYFENTSEFSNAAPNLHPHAVAGAPYRVLAGGRIPLDGSTTSDTNQSKATLLYQWDLDGDGNFGENGEAAARGDERGLNPFFSAQDLSGPSDFPISLRVTDTEGLVDQDTVNVRILYAIPIQGTSGNDVIKLERSSSADELVVTINGTSSGVSLTDVGGYTIDAGSGNDTVSVSESIEFPGSIYGDAAQFHVVDLASIYFPGTIYGGPGNDVLVGGGSNDRILGGDGNDRVNGGGGNDMVLGEAGDDTIVMSRGYDVLRPGIGRNSIDSGSVSKSIIRVEATAAAIGASGRTRRGLPALVGVSGQIYVDVEFDGSGAVSSSFTDAISMKINDVWCTATVSLSGGGPVQSPNYHADVGGPVTATCNADTIRSGVAGPLTGSLSLRNGTITARGSFLMPLGDGRSARVAISRTDLISELETRIN